MTPDAAGGINWHRMPPMIQEVAKRCGPETALALLKHCDGRQVWVPLPGAHPNRGNHGTRNNPLRVLQPEIIAKLMEHYPGQILTIPVAYHALLAERNAAIRAERDAGAHPRDLAPRYGLTERMIWAIVGPAPDDPRQSNLF